MRKPVFLWPILCLPLILLSPAHAATLTVVKESFLWTSGNLSKVDPRPCQPAQKVHAEGNSRPLSTLSFNRHFDFHGMPPPWDFLHPLAPGSSPVAAISEGQLVFRKTGKTLPLKRPTLPPQADLVPSYLVSLLGMNHVLVVHPYYLFRDKESFYVTEVYSDEGDLLFTFQSLPTHAASDHPHLLISPEKSGCCESVKWSIRFYDLRQGSVSEYSCPEGFCGDVLFTRLWDGGPYLVALETVGRVADLGASMQTNFYVVGQDGTLSASGKTLYVLRESNLDRRKLESLSPYGISNLISADPLPVRNSWILRFVDGDRVSALRLKATYSHPAPSTVYLLSKDDYPEGRKVGVRVGDRHLGSLPLLVATEPGQIPLTFSSEGKKPEMVTYDVEPERVHIVTF